MTVNPFGENMYILWDETTRDAVVVDPGMMRDAEREMVTNFIEGQQLNVKHILLTHLHLDHVTGARWLADKTGAEVCGSPLDAPLGLELKRQVEEFHLKVECEPLTLDRELNDGDTIPLGDETIQVLHLPGHSPGGLAFYLPQSALLISGDTCGIYRLSTNPAKNAPNTPSNPIRLVSAALRNNTASTKINCVTASLNRCRNHRVSLGMIKTIAAA